MIHNSCHKNDDPKCGSGPPPYECMKNIGDTQIPGLNLSNNHSSNEKRGSDSNENMTHNHESLNMNHDYDTEDSDLEDVPFVSILIIWAVLYESQMNSILDEHKLIHKT